MTGGVVIREATPQDAAAVASMFDTLDRETKFLLYEPGERINTTAAQMKRLTELESSEQDAFFVATEGDRIVGFCAGAGGHTQRNRHELHIIIGIVDHWTGRGIGKRLLASVESWARQRRFHRLQLTVMAHNERAIRLYTRLGYVKEGLRRDSLRVDGGWIDEHLMAKLI